MCSNFPKSSAKARFRVCLLVPPSQLSTAHAPHRTERRTLLQSARKMCELYCDGLFSDRKLFAEQDFVQVCFLFVETQKTLEEQSDEPDKQTQKLWWDL